MINILLSRSILNNADVYDEAKIYIKPEMKVCIVAFSFFENENNQEVYQAYYGPQGLYYDKMINCFATYGIGEKQISWLNYFLDEKATFIEKIKAADILYFPGGAPDLMMQRIVEKDILEPLASFDKIIIGPSAGAMIQNDYFHISPDADYQNFSMHKGLGYIKDFGYEVHFRRRKKQKKAIRKVSHIMKRPLYTIPDDGAIIVTDDTVKLIATAKLYYKNQKKVR